MRIKMKDLLLLIILSATFLNSCEDKKAPEQNTATELSNKPIVVSDAWIRPGAMNRNSAAFFKITNNTGIEDTLYEVKSDLAKVVQIHETFDKGNDMKGMRHIEQLIIPAKSSIELKPGSFHIMLIGLNQDLKNGDTGKLTLNFKVNGNVELDVKVN
jgi:hypothetical protein